MKRQYDWMNGGKAFTLPNLADTDMQTRLDLFYIQKKAERKFIDLKPDGIKPDDKDLTDEWMNYLNIVSTQANIDIICYMLKSIDKSVTKEFILANLDIKEISKIIFELFPVGEKPPVKKENVTEEQ